MDAAPRAYRSSEAVVSSRAVASVAERRDPRRRLGGASIVLTLVAAALVAWIVSFERISGMDSGPGADLGGLGWYLSLWLTMMAAMMFPSVAPMVLLFARVSRERSRRRHPLSGDAVLFMSGYLAVWTAYGLVAYVVYRVVRSLDPAFLAWDRGGPYVVGALVAGAGLYQLSPLKAVCLKHCRGPLHFLLGGWRKGRLGAVRMGAEHGAYCVGCCWGLMLVLFALGVMSLSWMAVVAAIIFVEKVAPFGLRFRHAVAAGLVGLGIWVAVAPASVPGVTTPGTDHGMQMDGMTP